MEKYKGILIWFIAAAFVLYGFCLNMTAAVLAEHIQSTLHVSEIEIAMAIGSYILGFAIMQIPAGYLLDRYHPRLIVSVAILLVLIGNIILSQTQSYVIFCAGNFLIGTGSSFSFIAAGVLISEWFKASLFPILFGLVETFCTITVAFLAYFLIFEIDKHSWQQLYFVLAIAGVILFIFAILFIEIPYNETAARFPSLKKSLITIFYNKQIWLCSIAAAFSFGVLLSYADFWFVRVQRFYAVNAKETALIGSMFYLGIALGTPLLGWMSNLLKSRKLMLHLSLILGNMALILALYLPHFSLQTLMIIKIVSFLTGFFLSGSMLFFTVVKENISNQMRGVALSFANTMVFLMNSFMLLVPYLFLTSQSTQFFTYLWILPFSIMISILLVYFIKE